MTYQHSTFNIQHSTFNIQYLTPRPGTSTPVHVFNTVAGVSDSPASLIRTSTQHLCCCFCVPLRFCNLLSDQSRQNGRLKTSKQVTVASAVYKTPRAHQALARTHVRTHVRTQVWTCATEAKGAYCECPRIIVCQRGATDGVRLDAPILHFHRRPPPRRLTRCCR